MRSEEVQEEKKKDLKQLNSFPACITLGKNKKQCLELTGSQSEQRCVIDCKNTDNHIKGATK